MRTKWYIYTRLQLNTHSQPTDHKKTSVTRNTIQQEIMSVYTPPPPPNNNNNNKISCNPRKLCETSQSAFHPTHIRLSPHHSSSQLTNKHPSPPPTNFATYFFASKLNPFFCALYLSLYLFLSVYHIEFFGSRPWQQIFAQSDSLSFFLRDRFLRQFSKLLFPLPLALSLSFCISFWLLSFFSVRPFASSASCKCCPSANKIYFLFAPLA